MEINEQIDAEIVEDVRISPWGRVLSLFDVFRKSRFLRWFVYGSIVGILSGLGAGIYFYALEWGLYHAGSSRRVSMPRPAGEQIVPALHGAHIVYWLLVFLPAMGGLLSGLIVYIGTRGGGERGPTRIEAFHNKGYDQGARTIPKGHIFLADTGNRWERRREGPVAQIGAGISSWLAGTTGLDIREKRLMLLAGCAGGLSAIFRTPLGGAFMAAEILYREDLETDGIILCIISSLVSYEIFTAIFGRQPILASPLIEFPGPRQLLIYASIGLIPAFRLDTFL